MSRLADILTAMDDKRVRRSGLGGTPRLGESAGPSRHWRIVGTLVILATMGAFTIAVMLRSQGQARSFARSGALAHVSAPAAPLRVLPPREISGGDRVGALMRTGIDAARSGDLEQAVGALRKAVEVDPANAEAWDSLGVALVRSGDESSGIEAFRRALRAAPGNPEAHRNLAVVLDRQGRAAEAARHYRAFLAKGPSDSPDRATITARLEEMGARRSGE